MLFEFAVPEVPLVAFVDVDDVVLLVVFVVTAESVLTLLLDPLPLPPIPPLPLPFPTPTPSPVTAEPSVDFFCFLGFLHVVLIFTFVSTDEASVHCGYKEAKFGEGGNERPKERE